MLAARQLEEEQVGIHDLKPRKFGTRPIVQLKLRQDPVFPFCGAHEPNGQILCHHTCADAASTAYHHQYSAAAAV